MSLTHSEALEQNYPAELARTTIPIAICPKEVAYSQKSIGFTIFNGDNIPGASVLHWIDDLPYTIPIDIIKTNNDEYSSFDNRRLYAARNNAPPEYNIAVRCHES